MAMIQNEVSIHDMTNKYGSHSQQIKDLITQVESAQQYRISNKQKNLAENSNCNRILQWECAHIRCQFFHKSYTDLELQSACIARILLIYTHPVIFKEYGDPKSSLTIALRTIYPLLQSKNLKTCNIEFS